MTAELFFDTQLTSQDYPFVKNERGKKLQVVEGIDPHFPEYSLTAILRTDNKATLELETYAMQFTDFPIIELGAGFFMHSDGVAHLHRLVLTLAPNDPNQAVGTLPGTVKEEEETPPSLLTLSAEWNQARQLQSVRITWWNPWSTYTADYTITRVTEHTYAIGISSGDASYSKHIPSVEDIEEWLENGTRQAFAALEYGLPRLKEPHEPDDLIDEE